MEGVLRLYIDRIGWIMVVVVIVVAAPSTMDIVYGHEGDDCWFDSLAVDGDGASPDGGSCGPIDCDDSDAAIHPAAEEICTDSIDNNCNGNVDPAEAEDNSMYTVILVPLGAPLVTPEPPALLRVE